eukprot:c5392_g1_i1.p1 GENE.c5392_g1_i1~~c5392_g1_i1.p1  ORF type:complete len:203 (+),score=50.46 c5392_g1_i1:38-646(+)
MPLFGPNIEDQLFKLKFTAKQLQRLSKKAEKDEKESKNKVKKAIEKGNNEGARIYAQDAIRHKNEALNYLRLSSRVDGVASKVEQAVRMGQVSKTMSGVVKGMDKVLDSLNVEKISKTMEDFARQFEDTDVRSAYMSNAMGDQVGAAVAPEEVDNLIAQVADMHGLEVNDALMSATAPRVGQISKQEEDELASRLRQVREQT